MNSSGLAVHLVNRALFALEDRSRHGIPIDPFLAAEDLVRGAGAARGEFHPNALRYYFVVGAEERGSTEAGRS